MWDKAIINNNLTTQPFVKFIVRKYCIDSN